METMMVNHPTRSQRSIDAAIRRLLIKYDLTQVEITVTNDRAFARALPASWNVIVTQRREAALGGHDHSLSEASKIVEASYRQIASAMGTSIDDAITGLTNELGK